MDTLDIKITNNCNYCCPYCFAEAGKKNLSEKNFLKAMLLAKEVGIKKVEFCGGEPLLNRNFNKFVKIARENGYKLILRTNGILVKKKIKVISKNFSWVGISLDGLAKANGQMRVSKRKLSDKDKFEIPLEAINLLRKENPKIKIILSTTATKENYNDIPKLGKYLIEHSIQINMWKINLFMPRRFRAKTNKNRYNISLGRLEKLTKRLDTKRLNKRGIDVVIRKGKINGGDCLILSPDGKVSISSTRIANIDIDSPKDIASLLRGNQYIKDIEENKKITYVNYC